MLCVSARLVALLGRRRKLLQCIGCTAARVLRGGGLLSRVSALRTCWDGCQLHTHRSLVAELLVCLCASIKLS